MRDNPYFLYVGNAYPHKNLKRLMDAVVQLNKNSDRIIKLKISSSRNIFVRKIEKVIFGSEYAKYIEVLGFVDEDKLSKLYSGSLAFVFPSLSEGFGLPGIEAMREGTILLASDIPVFREIYGSNAIYFNPLDFTSIEMAMREAIEMSEAEREMRINKALLFVKKYSWRKMAEETLKVYEQLSK